MVFDIAKTYTALYNKIISLENLYFAYRKARKGKSKKLYVVEFTSNLRENLFFILNSSLHNPHSKNQYKFFQQKIIFCIITKLK